MKLPDFSFERKVAKKGYRYIAGVDEVGRGSFAGPVVAAAVAFAHFSNFHFPVFNKFSKEIIINDSKQLTVKQRKRANYWIKKNALAHGIGIASVSQINRLGIKKASEIAFRKAIENCKLKIDYLLVDAFYIPYVRGLRRRNQLAIIHGDERSVSIAAASIIAKVYRDRLMEKLGSQAKYKKYKWGKNKGYGTREHQDSILKHGVTKLHRKSFIESWVKKSKLEV